MKLSITLEEAKVFLNAAHEVKSDADGFKPLLPEDEMAILAGLEKKVWTAMSKKQLESFRPLRGTR